MDTIPNKTYFSFSLTEYVDRGNYLENIGGFYSILMLLNDTTLLNEPLGFPYHSSHLSYNEQNCDVGGLCLG